MEILWAYIILAYLVSVIWYGVGIPSGSGFGAIGVLWKMGQPRLWLMYLVPIFAAPLYWPWLAYMMFKMWLRVRGNAR